MKKPWRLALILALVPMSAWAAEESDRSCPPTRPDNLPRFVLSYPSGNPREAGIPPQLQPGDFYDGFRTGTHVVSSPDQVPGHATESHCVVPTGRTGPILIP